MHPFRHHLVLFVLIISINATAQDHYQYSVDLTRLENDRLTVELIVPEAVGDSATFCFGGSGSEGSASWVDPG